MSIGGRIRGARRAREMSQQALADAVGVSKNMISKYEKDESTPPSSTLVKLCRALGVKVEYFFRQFEVTITDGAFRRHSRLTKTRQEAIESQIQERIERYLEVEEMLFGADTDREQPPPLESRPIIRTVKEAEQAAAALRKEWQLGLDPIENLCETLEDHGVKVVCHSVDDRKFSGWSCWVNDTVPVVVVNSHVKHMALHRQRFTLAHELAHVWFQLPDDLRLAEKFANRFAGAFLLPAVAVDQEFAHQSVKLMWSVLAQLSLKWGLSMGAWVYRLTTLGRLTQPQAEFFWKQYTAAGYKTNGEVVDRDAPLEKSTRLERLIRQAWIEGMISDARAAELSDDAHQLWRDILAERGS